MLTVYYLGNFDPPHSTENHVCEALGELGHRVVRAQENNPDSWRPVHVDASRADVVLWTRTWHLPEMPQRAFIDECRRAGVGVVGFHLDRWWGLPREHQVIDEPFFGADLVFTADGSHDRRWVEAGVNHRWSPPAIAASQVGLHTSTRRVRRPPVGFVGGWQSYHPEWPWRREMVEGLRRRYRGSFRWYPTSSRGRAIRGRELTALYGQTRVMAGDSLLLGGVDRYWSDRVPETLGRGGILVHPYTPGLAKVHGEHLAFYDLDPDDPDGSLDRLCSAIDAVLAMDDDDVARWRVDNVEHIRAGHTYAHRLADVLDIAAEEGLIR